MFADLLKYCFNIILVITLKYLLLIIKAGISIIFKIHYLYFIVNFFFL